ncbi:MFS transporter [Pararobbsia silviterrae]|uniref:MFS transporter n=1 Tax=Pararobbsia silviterrae TaxID=1792498 RepID=A0A494XXA2_9BURK|nr:MFS transporter [Pararobbsia silviterrae]RKP53648.1 MFS transporter [Pararobbsia silviterrae]
MQVCEIEHDACLNESAATRARRNTLALLAVCLAAMMFSLEISSVPVILPTLEVVLHGDFKQIEWIMNAYTLACTTVLMATGTLADRFGRKRVFVVATLLFGVASLACGLASSMSMLIASRFLQGASGGAMLICLVAVLSHQFPQGAERARAFSVWGIVLGIGLGFGPLVGGAIVALSNWKWVFWVHVLITVVVLGLARLGVRESRDPQARKLDVAGMVTLSAAVFGFVWFITHGADEGVTSSSALTALAFSAVCLIAFLRVEKRSPHPLFDFSVLKVRAFSGALAGSAGMNCSFWPFIIYLPIYFQSALGDTPLTAGISLLAYTLPTLVFPPIGERLAVRYAPAYVIPGGLLTIGIGFFLMRLGIAADHANGTLMVLGCLIAGAGLGLTNTPVTNTTTGSVSAARAGMASGIDMSARFITLAIHIALMGALLVKGVSRHLEQALSATPLAGAHAGSWQQLASRVASGDLASLDVGASASLSAVQLDAVGRAALVNGFGWVTLYGGIAVCVLALISYALFSGGLRGVRRSAERALDNA